MTEYWYARRHPVGHWSNAMAPVSPKARRVFWVFAGGIAVGMLAFFVFGLLGYWRIGAGIFAVLAALSGWYYLTVPYKRFDRHHTAEDYRSGRVGADGAGAVLETVAAPGSRVSLTERFSRIGDYWRPALLAELRAQSVILERISGEGPWQKTGNTEEMLLVWKGGVRLESGNRRHRLSAGDVFLLPRDQAYRIAARREAQVLLLRPVAAEAAPVPQGEALEGKQLDEDGAS